MCFRTNKAAHNHQRSAGTSSKPCFLIFMRGVVGASEEVYIPIETEEYMEVRYKGRYERKERKIRQTGTSSNDSTVRPVANQLDLIPKSIVHQDNWNKYPYYINWGQKGKQENPNQSNTNFSITENFPNMYDTSCIDSQSLTYQMNYNY